MAPKAVVLTCDQVIIDGTSGKKSLIGIFDVIWSHTFPAQHGQMHVYGRISGAPGQKVLTTLRVVLAGLSANSRQPTHHIPIERRLIHARRSAGLGSVSVHFSKLVILNS